MKKDTRIQIIGLIVTLMATTAVHAQVGKYYGLWWDGSTEHFTAIDPYTSAKTVLGSIPGVTLIASGNSAFATDCNRYVFVGGSTTGDMFYYVIDASTGAVFSKSPRSENIDDIEYSPRDKTFYGLWWSGSTEYLVSINPYTSIKTIVGGIPGVTLIAGLNSAFDTDCNRYVFVGGSTTSDMSYYVMDASTGAVLAKSPRSENINNLAYSTRDKAYYGLWWDGSAEHLVSLDPFTSDKTVAGGIPGVTLIAGGNYAFAPDCNRYLFVGGSSGSTMSYQVLDAQAGTSVSTSPQAENINNIEYGGISTEGDAGGGSDVAGLTASMFSKTSFIVHPNPLSKEITLEINNADGKEFSFAMKDIAGKSVINMGGIKTGMIRIDGNGLTRGIYFFQFKNNQVRVGSGKLILD